MAVSSNLYSEKVFSEHPIALFALDETADYISLISESQRMAPTWTPTDCVVSDESIASAPFINSNSILVQGNVGPGEAKIVSSNIFNFTQINQLLGSFSVGAYVYVDNPYMQSVSIGYEYTDTTTAQTITKLETYNSYVFKRWIFLSGTFDIPNENTNARVVIQFNYGGGGSDPEEYQFYVNGVTVGQWSETYQTSSLGVQPVTIDENIALDLDLGVPTYSYGLDNYTGYYLVKDRYLTARNTAVPLVYGSSNVTKISQNESLPSLIVPGFGFLNNRGKYNEYTAEMWLRINNSTSSSKRIFGPIASTDGLYVEEGFITLLIGNRFGSHFIGEWSRPMLVHIRISQGNASVLINGEIVISLEIDTSTLSFPDEFIVVDEVSLSQDWLGFYGHDELGPIEIEGFALYSYQVPAVVAKRRWVWGQGVVSPETINTAFSGISAFIDYPFANYTANYNYPSFARWDQGYFSNLQTSNIALSTPNYSLPNIKLGNYDTNTWYEDLMPIQNSGPNFVTFRPNSSWNNEVCLFEFTSLNILNSPIKTFYGAFEPTNFGQETILLIKNKTNNDYFEIVVDDFDVKYRIYSQNVLETIFSSIFTMGDIINIGIDIQKMSNYYGNKIARFFSNPSQLSMYVGGNGVDTFTGKMYVFSFGDDFDLLKVKNLFFENGILSVSGAVPESSLELIWDGGAPNQDSWDLEIDGGNASTVFEELLSYILFHVGSYTLKPYERYNTFYVDIAVSGYWEDYIPLSYFSKLVRDDEGSQYFSLDFLQFNIGYPKTTILIEEELSSEEWTYQDLNDKFALPITYTYAQLDNPVFTGWNDYDEMSRNAVTVTEYDTSQSLIKSYVTFQSLSNGGIVPLGSFTNYVKPPRYDVIVVDDYQDWPNTKFEVLDGSIIYPSKDVDFEDIAIVSHIEFTIEGILSKTVSLNRLEIASQALNQDSFNPVGTRFGLPIFPYTKTGFYFDYKAKNPFGIYKGSTPYLYLTKNSGIVVKGECDPYGSRGLSIPVNANASNQYSISAVQLWVRCDNHDIPYIPTKIFEVDAKNDSYEFFGVADVSSSRVRIFAKSKNTGQEIKSGIAYYINGNLVKEPLLNAQEWTVIGISFANSIDFSGYVGSINLTGPLLFNNVAYYLATNLQEVKSQSIRPWSRVLSDGMINLDWLYWNDNFSWDGVLVLSTTELYGVNPSAVYKSYLGTNVNIIDDNEGLVLNAEKLRAVTDISWNTQTAIAV